MNQTIGQTIRRLRKERGITQEELADALGITSQAVSKWENDAGMPDISQLVPLANLFKVPMDVLFSRDTVSLDEQIDELIREINTVRYPECSCETEKFHELTEALKIYPNHPKLLDEIVRKAIFLVSPAHSEQNTHILTTAIRAADSYIKNSQYIGDIIRMTANKIDLYAGAGRYAEAEELAKELDIPIVSREMYLAHISSQRKDYPAEIKHKQNSIAQILTFLAGEIGELALAYRNNGQLEEAVEVNIVNLRLPYTMHGNGKFHAPLFNWHAISGFEAACELVLLERYEDALDLLEKIFDYGEEQCRLCTDHAPVTSPLLCNMDMTYFHGEMSEADYLHGINWDGFEPLRKYDRFQKLLERYRAYPDHT